jgi:hypothetical protein
MEMLMRALDISPNRAPYEGCTSRAEGQLIVVEGNGLKCTFFPDPDEKNTVILLDQTPGIAYEIYWSIKSNSNGMLSISGSDGKTTYDKDGKEVSSLPGANHLVFSTNTDDIRLLNSVQRLTEQYRQHFPKRPY